MERELEETMPTIYKCTEAYATCIAFICGENVSRC